MGNTLENKVAIVTGSASGIGREISKLFVSERCKVIAADNHYENLKILQKELIQESLEIAIIEIDISKEVDILKMVQFAKDTYGKIDILVNNAGIMDNFESIADVDNETWDKVFKINLEGPFKTIRAIIKEFLLNQKGNIINISSIGGLNGGRAGVAYTSSKHALIGLTKNTGFLYSKQGIQCNCIAPGAVETSIGTTIDQNKITELVKERIFSGMVLNPRIAKANEIAQIALFLASDKSSFINGTVIIADAGWTAY
jgi:NAD(P)-dependent dehydrogenase (short-subunit alcohol dehydrogenase family)